MILLGFACAVRADVIVLQDLFDYGTLAESGQVKGGFGEIDNGSGSSGTAVEGGGVVSMTDGSTPNIYGILSSNTESFGVTRR